MEAAPGPHPVEGWRLTWPRRPRTPHMATDACRPACSRPSPPPLHCCGALMAPLPGSHLISWSACVPYWSLRACCALCSARSREAISSSLRETASSREWISSAILAMSASSSASTSLHPSSTALCMHVFPPWSCCMMSSTPPCSARYCDILIKFPSTAQCRHVAPISSGMQRSRFPPTVTSSRATSSWSPDAALCRHVCPILACTKSSSSPPASRRYRTTSRKPPSVALWRAVFPALSWMNIRSIPPFSHSSFTVERQPSFAATCRHVAPLCLSTAMMSSPSSSSRCTSFVSPDDAACTRSGLLSSAFFSSCSTMLDLRSLGARGTDASPAALRVLGALSKYILAYSLGCWSALLSPAAARFLGFLAGAAGSDLRAFLAALAGWAAALPSCLRMMMSLLPCSRTWLIEERFPFSVVPLMPQLTKHGTHSLQPLSSPHECFPADMRSVISFQPPARWCAPESMKRPEKQEPQLLQARRSTEKGSPWSSHEILMLRTTESGSWRKASLNPVTPLQSRSDTGSPAPFL
mmetsp:Transcript_45620/g.111040  ORF Transcript_45620/g.111040 Transcript_45620/m.111040 type:complete len:525 (-) Transcript_45620:656-2230(-)